MSAAGAPAAGRLRAADGRVIPGEVLRRLRRNPLGVVRVGLAIGRGAYYRLKYRVLGRRVVIGREFRVYGPLDIRGPGTVIFGDRCTVVSSRLAPTTPYTHAPEAVIRFGNDVRLTGTRIGCQERVEVGDGAGLSEARIMDTDFHAVEIPESGLRYNTMGQARPVVIGRNVWVGVSAIVLKGSRIGDNSVVAAGAVVAQKVPSDVVVFGNPARVVWRLGRSGPPPADRDPASGPRPPDAPPS